MGDVIEVLTTATNTVEVAATGPQGAPGVGVPTGGSALQVLRKVSGTDYDTEWAAAGSGSGSVTSVALAGTGLSISGSPITTSGTITANVAYGTTAGTATQGNDSRIANITANSITTAQGANSGGSGGTITMRGGITGSNGAGGNSGSINLQGSDDRDEGAFNGGSIDLSGFSGTGGNITSTGNSEGAGGSLTMSGIGFAGGSINTSGGGSGVGGSIDTSNDGGSINTRGTGSIGFGESGTRTTLTGTATENRAISLPNASGRIQVEGQPIGNTTPAAGTFTTLAANNGTLTASAPVLDLAQTWNNAAVAFTGMRIDCTATANSTSSSYFSIARSGATHFSITAPNASTPQINIGGSGYTTVIRGRTAAGVGLNFDGAVGVGGSLQFGVGSGTAGGDVILLRDAAADTIALQRSTNPQVFRIYNTYTDASNHERLSLRWASNVAIIGTEKAGTGSARALELQTDGVTRLSITSNGANCDISSVLRPSSGSTFDLGGNTRRWSRLFVNTTILFGDSTSAADPAIKKSGTTLQVRLADDSAFAPFVSGDLGIGVTPERPLHIQGSAAFGRMDRQGTNGPAWLMIRMATGTTVSSSWLFGPATGVASVANDDFSIIDYGTSTSGTSGTQRLTIAKSDGQLTVNGNLNLSTKDLVTDTTTGTKIGTGTTQKIGFFNATPVVQQAAVADATDAASTQARLNDLLARLRTLGLIAT